MRGDKLGKTRSVLILLLFLFHLFFMHGLICVAEETKSNFEIIMEKNDSSEIVNENLLEKSAEEIKVIKAEELDLGDYIDTMIIGEKQLLVITVLPLDTTDKSVKISSDNTEVATVNGLGRITAISVGTTTIRVKSGKIKEKFILTVKEKEEEEQRNISVADIEVTDFESELEVDKTVILSATVLPSDATNASITYSSDSPSVATVSSTGEVKGISTGNVTITLTAGNFTKNVELTVKVATKIIQLNSTYAVLKVGETFSLKAEVLPKTAAQQLSYKSISPDIASVSGDGIVTALKNGNTTIIVSNGDISNAVTLIVNEEAVQENLDNENLKEEDGRKLSNKENTLIQKIKVQDIVDIEAADYKVITKPVLKILYKSGNVLKISSSISV